MSNKSNNKKFEIMERLKRSQQETDFEINTIADNIKNITTGMDIVKIELECLSSAPNDWNFYAPLNGDKMQELIDSIEENGLLNPVILWERDGYYMILSGHNRVRAYSMLYEQTKDEKYSKIFAYVKKKDEIAEEEARTIIIDTNFVQRQLSTIEKTKSIVAKYNTLGRKKRNSEGKKTAEIIAEQYNLKIRQIYNYYKLHNLVPEFMSRIDMGFLSLKEGLKLAELRPEFQKNLYDNYLNLLTNKKIAEINFKTTEEEIVNQIKKENNVVNVNYKIPGEMIEDFKKYVDEWFKAKINL